MNNLSIIKISECPWLAKAAANWFHAKWGIPLKAYTESINECIHKKLPQTAAASLQSEPAVASAVPQWYVVLEGDKIIGGCGVIENDFHNRKDLTPNVCAVYVEEDYRCQGIAGKLLQFVCNDMKERGIPTLYLLTDHTSFYERYQWEFLCMVQGDGEEKPSRMYVHRESPL